MAVHIGSKFTGKYAGHMDTTTGTYFEVLPKIDGDSLKLQRALLAPAPTPRAMPMRRPCRLPTLSGRQN